MFRRLVATSRAPQSMVVSMLCDLAKIYQYGRGCPAGTGGHPESGTPSKVWSWALVCWSTAISKSSFTKKSFIFYFKTTLIIDHIFVKLLIIILFFTILIVIQLSISCSSPITQFERTRVLSNFPNRVMK